MFRIIGGDKKEYGPITTDQLRQWMVENRVNGQTLIRPEEGGEWRPLSAFPELNPTLASDTAAPQVGLQAAVSTTDPVSAVIPYRNMPALISYYLAVFSLIPCLGIPLGLAAVVAQQSGGDELIIAMFFAGAWITFVAAVSAMAMMLPAALGVVIAEAFAIRTWIFHVANGGL